MLGSRAHSFDLLFYLFPRLGRPWTPARTTPEQRISTPTAGKRGPACTPLHQNHVPYHPCEACTSHGPWSRRQASVLYIPPAHWTHSIDVCKPARTKRKTKMRGAQAQKVAGRGAEARNLTPQTASIERIAYGSATSCSTCSPKAMGSVLAGLFTPLLPRPK